MTTFRDSGLSWTPAPSAGLPLCPTPRQDGPASGSRSLLTTRICQPNFLVPYSAECWTPCLLAHVSRESSSVPPTVGNSTGALSPCPDAQARATAIHGLPLTLTLLSLLLFSRLHLTSLLVDCCVASLKLCRSHLKTLNFGLPQTQDCTCVRDLGPHPLISPSLPWEELSSWKSSAAQTIPKT